MRVNKPLASVHGDNDLDYWGNLVLTRGLGHDPNDHSGENFQRLPHTKLARLNNGYGPEQGTIPLPQYYGDFAVRTGNFVEASPGCSIWCIGNEMNFLAVEAPQGQPITPAQYAECFTLCRDEIKSRPFHSGDQVCIGAVAPWNNTTSYPGNPDGSWIRYFEDIQHELGAGGCDGFFIHSYVREQTVASITDPAKMDKPFQECYWGFLHYINWMAAILPRFQGLPVYMTEFCVAGEPWMNVNTGVIRAAYQEIDRWNQARPDRGIHVGPTVYRWSVDKWRFDDKPAVQEDFTQAAALKYTFPPGEEIEPPEEEDMLKNPGLEPPFNQQDVGEIQIARYWKADYNEVHHPSSKRPEWKAETRDVGKGRVLEGATSQKWFWTYGVGQGWISQVVHGLTSGLWYEFSAHVYVWSSEFDNADESVQPGKMWCRLGVHPWGVDNANDLAVEYGGAIVDNYDKWVKLSTVFQARSDRAALFLWSSPEHPAKHNDVHWDSTSLKVWECDGGGTEPPIDPPDPGTCQWNEERLRQIVGQEVGAELDKRVWTPVEIATP